MLSAEAYRRRRKLDERYRLLRDWYGRDAAVTEMAAHCPEAKKLSDLTAEVLKDAMPPDYGTFCKLSEEWEKIAGDELAVMTKPGAYSGGELTVEVVHPLYLREVEMCGDLLKSRVNELLHITCATVRFVPSSGRKKR